MVSPVASIRCGARMELDVAQPPGPALLSPDPWPARATGTHACSGRGTQAEQSPPGLRVRLPRLPLPLLLASFGVFHL